MTDRHDRERYGSYRHLPSRTERTDRAAAGAVAQPGGESGSRAAWRWSRNDAEAIARGAAHQAELCRQWSCSKTSCAAEAGRRSAPPSADASGSSLEAEHSARLQAEWETLGARIRYLTRVHWSLLRHLQRSLAVLNRVVDSCAPTYTPDPGLLGRNAQADIRLQAGE